MKAPEKSEPLCLGPRAFCFIAPVFKRPFKAIVRLIIKNFQYKRNKNRCLWNLRSVCSHLIYLKKTQSGLITQQSDMVVCLMQNMVGHQRQNNGKNFTFFDSLCSYGLKIPELYFFSMCCRPRRSGPVPGSSLPADGRKPWKRSLQYQSIHFRRGQEAHG